jgi:hypothetical protein
MGLNSSVLTLPNWNSPARNVAPLLNSLDKLVFRWQRE